LPAELDDILSKALEKDPEKRFQSAEQFHRALETLADELTPASPTRKELHARPTTPAPVALVPVRIAKPLATLTRWLRYWQVAAAIVLALVSVYAIRGYLPRFNSPGAHESVLESVELAKLPFIWPANLVLVPAVKYPTKPVIRKKPKPSAPVPMPTEERAQKKSPFLRAMGHVVHPFHHDSQAAKASGYPSN
jgi:hypothetical protein